jgi:hypothetical protein
MVFNTTWKIFQIYHGDLFYLWRKPEYPEKTTYPSQVTNIFKARIKWLKLLFVQIEQDINDIKETKWFKRDIDGKLISIQPDNNRYKGGTHDN